MALSFKINRRQHHHGLCLKLSGDFDGSSAAELTAMLRSHSDARQRIFIDTGALRSIHPFGLECFKRRYRQPNSLELVWEVKYAGKLSASDDV